MTWKLTQREFESVSRLPPLERFKHFVKRVADWGEVWCLRGQSGWTVMGDQDGKEYIPIWPHPKYAEACSNGEWEGRKPEPIQLRDWLDKWTPGLTQDQRFLTIFPTATDKGFRSEERRVG